MLGTIALSITCVLSAAGATTSTDDFQAWLDAIPAGTASRAEVITKIIDVEALKEQFPGFDSFEQTYYLRPTQDGDGNTVYQKFIFRNGAIHNNPGFDGTLFQVIDCEIVLENTFYIKDSSSKYTAYLFETFGDDFGSFTNSGAGLYGGNGIWHSASTPFNMTGGNIDYFLNLSVSSQVTIEGGRINRFTEHPDVFNENHDEIPHPFISQDANVMVFEYGDGYSYEGYPVLYKEPQKPMVFKTMFTADGTIIADTYGSFSSLDNITAVNIFTDEELPLYIEDGFIKIGEKTTLPEVVSNDDELQLWLDAIANGEFGKETVLIRTASTLVLNRSHIIPAEAKIIFAMVSYRPELTNVIDNPNVPYTFVLQKNSDVSICNWSSQASTGGFNAYIEKDATLRIRNCSFTTEDEKYGSFYNYGTLEIENSFISGIYNSCLLYLKGEGTYGKIHNQGILSTYESMASESLIHELYCEKGSENNISFTVEKMYVHGVAAFYGNSVATISEINLYKDGYLMIYPNAQVNLGSIYYYTGGMMDLSASFIHNSKIDVKVFSGLVSKDSPTYTLINSKNQSEPISKSIMDYFNFIVVDENGEPDAGSARVVFDENSHTVVLEKTISSGSDFQDWLDSYGVPDQENEIPVAPEVDIDGTDITFNDFQWFLDGYQSGESSGSGGSGLISKVMFRNIGRFTINEKATLRVSNINFESDFTGTIDVYGTLIIDINVYIYKFEQFVHVHPGGKVIFRNPVFGDSGRTGTKVIYNDGGEAWFYGGTYYGTFVNVGGNIYIYHNHYEYSEQWNINWGYTYIYGYILSEHGGRVLVGDGTRIIAGDGYDYCIYTRHTDIILHRYVWFERTGGTADISSDGIIWLPGDMEVLPVIIYEGEDTLIKLTSHLTAWLRIIYHLKIQVNIHIIIVGEEGVYTLTYQDFEWIEAQLPEDLKIEWDNEKKAIYVTTVDGIEDTWNDTADDCDLYDLSGRHVGKLNNFDNLDRGIYLDNRGKKHYKN